MWGCEQHHKQGYNKKDALTESVVVSSNYAIVAYLTSYDCTQVYILKTRIKCEKELGAVSFAV